MALDFKDLGSLKWYYQVLVVMVLCGAGLLALWYVELSDLETQIDQRTKQIEDLHRTIAASLVQQKRLEQIKKDAMDLQEKLEMLKMVLPLDKETEQIFRAVQQLAGDSGLQVTHVGPRAQIDHEVYTEYPIDLEANGPYHSVGAFLDRVRQLPRIVNINALRLQSRASTGAPPVSSVTAAYTATTFVYKDEPIASTAPPAKTVK
jgi:type IV pilus assembly protein PilO